MMEGKQSDSFQIVEFLVWLAGFDKLLKFGIIEGLVGDYRMNMYI